MSRQEDVDPTVPNGRMLSRRRFLKLSALAAMGLISAPALAKRHTSHVRSGAARTGARRRAIPERSLAFYNTHTGEHLKTVYWAQGKYVSSAMSEIDYILRDHYTDEVTSIDGELLDLLYALHRRVDTRQSFHVVSAYRSPETNAMLRQFDGNVAQHSLHMVGKAVDIRLPDRRTSSIRRAALSLRMGGVGYYPDADFVHVDVGRVRCW